MFFSKSKETQPEIWKEITSSEQIQEIIRTSHDHPVGIFKHSTRCSISSMAKARIEREYNDSHPELYYLDLIRYREISNQIEQDLNVPHESPQLIVLSKGKVAYHASHGSVHL